MEGLLSPLGLGLALLWNFAVLASVQLTVRLIMAFNTWRTVLASLVLTLATVPISLGYWAFAGGKLTWMPLAIVLTGAAGWVVAVRVLRFRRQRSTVVAAIGIGLLSAPWGALLVRPPS